MRLFLILIGMVMASPVMAVSALLFINGTAPDETIFLNSAIRADFDLDGGENSRGELIATATTNDLICSGVGLLTSPSPNHARLQINLPGADPLVYYVDADFVYDADSTVLRVEPAGALEVVCTSSVLFLNGFE